MDEQGASIDLSHDFLTESEFTSFCDCVFNFGEGLYALEIRYPGDTNGSILAYNITCTVPVGYNNLVAKHPNFKIYLDKILEPTCNFLHFVSLKMSSNAGIEMHVDDGIDDHLKDSIGSQFNLQTLPKHTSCFYMKIPEILEGGQLYWNPKNTGTPSDDDTYVTPVENLNVNFLGTLWHGVSRITKSSGERCMFVAEQYVLSKRNLKKLANYDTPVIKAG